MNNLIWLLDQDIWLILMTQVDDHGRRSQIRSDFLFRVTDRQFSHFPSNIASLSRSSCQCCTSI